ncbi:Protein disulfide isomerase [Mycena chlorophos]|uniref:protein disulfide-isomerase n=1 Tax=Mycena chlorophos TaxID=658473 RepID=A0A8H6S447_MYCCL|nr:Protein disulfide isomerase [Mycena chlorophos]
MRFNAFVAPSILALASLVLADDTPSDVIRLTASTFLPLVEAEPLILVEFFAPWCGHCKALAPQYEEAATILKGKNIKIANVDCVDDAELCQANGIQGYPTLRVYRYGQATDYQGPRKADGIIAYMAKQALPAVAEVTAANLEEFQEADKVVAIAYVSSPTDVPAAAFSATAEKHRDDWLFGLSTDPAAAKAAKVTPPAVVVYRAFDEPSVTYPFPIADAQPSDFEDWIKELSIPVLDQVTSENYALYGHSPKPLAYIFMDPTADYVDSTLEAIRPVAAKYHSKLNFVWIDAVKYGDHAKALNLNEVKWPAFVVQDLGKQLKYPFDQVNAVEPVGIEAHVVAFLDGQLEPSLKSQPIPAEQLENVYDLVGKEFERIVFDDSKDVFVEFYASWCGHCKRLKPIWESLADHFAPVNESLTIAKFEAQENDLPPTVPFQISGFPTLKFKKAGQREFIEYEGDRSLESLIAFIESNAVNKLVLPPSQPPVQADAGDAAQGVLDPHDEL